MLRTFTARCAAVFLLCFCTAPFLAAQTPDIEHMYSILDDFFDSVNSKKDLTCTLSLITEKPNEPKAAYQFKLFRRDRKDQTCLVQLAPEAEKGTGYLQENDNLWTYDPSSHQFTHSSLKRNLGNSNAKISDVNTKSEFRQSYEILSVEETTLGKFGVYAVTAKALKSDASYAQEKFFIRKDVNLILKIESYGSSGRHMRTTLFAKYTKIDDRNLPVHQIHINELNKGEKTTQIFSDFDTSAVPDVVFTKAYLEKIN